MKAFKDILIFLVFFCLTLQIFAQRGYKVIYKAERKYEKGHYKKALKLLSKAENMNYGFCGTWMEADRAINLLRAKIYINKKEYQLASNSLDSIGRGHAGDNLDSIRIRIYQMEYGKDSLSRMIDSALVNTRVECVEENCFAMIPLMNGKAIKMKGNLFNSELIFMNDVKKKTEIWVKAFKESEHYKLIKEKS